MSNRSQRKARRQARSIGQELQIGRSHCGHCGAEFTFGASKILQQYLDMGVNHPPHIRKYVICARPSCGKRLYFDGGDE